jgi:hypothetical protein
VPRKGRARRFREARELKQGYDDGLFAEGNRTLADVDEETKDADWDEEDDEDDDDDEWEDEDDPLLEDSHQEDYPRDAGGLRAS